LRAIVDVHFIAMTVALTDMIGPINFADLTIFAEHTRIGTKSHRAAQITIGVAGF